MGIHEAELSGHGQGVLPGGDGVAIDVDDQEAERSFAKGGGGQVVDAIVLEEREAAMVVPGDDQGHARRPVGGDDVVRVRVVVGTGMQAGREQRNVLQGDQRAVGGAVGFGPQAL
jgi:hypothetical protein